MSCFEVTPVVKKTVFAVKTFKHQLIVVNQNTRTKIRDDKNMRDK